VTRAPIRGNLFAVANGIGAQIFTVWFLLLFFFYFHMMSHVTLRPWLYYFTVIILSCSGYVNGYVMARVLRIFGRENDWKPVAAVAAVCFPMYVTCMIFAIDFNEWFLSAEEEFDIVRASLTFILWSVLGVPTTFIGGARAMAADVTSNFK
jgi:hypothetical protein